MERAAREDTLVYDKADFREGAVTCSTVDLRTISGFEERLRIR